MKNLFTILLVLAGSLAFAQYEFEPSSKNPFGKINPKAPEQLKDFAPLIGLNNCSSASRNPDGSWADPVSMEWKFKYIMNGLAVQDETLKADGRHSGSLRHYNSDSARWYVHYYSSAPSTGPLSVWEGGKKGKDIVLYKEQKAPNGMDGSYRLTFSEITAKGFEWIGEWVDPTEQVVYPTWKIVCTKTQ